MACGHPKPATSNGPTSTSEGPKCTSGERSWASPPFTPSAVDELRALRRLQREQDPKSTFVFTTERGGPMTPDALNRMVKRLGNGSKLFGFSVHVHMLRHACGYKLANDGHDTRLIQDYLGHKSIMSTVRYTELSATKFKNVWR